MSTSNFIFLRLIFSNSTHANENIDGPTVPTGDADDNSDHTPTCDFNSDQSDSDSGSEMGSNPEDQIGGIGGDAGVCAEMNVEGDGAGTEDPGARRRGCDEQIEGM